MGAGIATAVGTPVTAAICGAGTDGATYGACTVDVAKYGVCTIPITGGPVGPVGGMTMVTTDGARTAGRAKQQHLHAKAMSTMNPTTPTTTPITICVRGAGLCI